MWVFEIFEKVKFEALIRPSTLKAEIFFKKKLMVAYVHIDYFTYQFSEESKGGGGTEKSVVLRGLKQI